MDFDLDLEVLRQGMKKRVTDSAFLHVGGCIHVDILKSIVKFKPQLTPATYINTIAVLSSRALVPTRSYLLNAEAISLSKFTRPMEYFLLLPSIRTFSPLLGPG